MPDWERYIPGRHRKGECLVLVLGLAAASLLGSHATAHAAAKAAPAVDTVWRDNKDAGDLWYNASFEVSGTNSTGIGAAVNCENGFCRHEVSGQCLQVLLPPQVYQVVLRGCSDTDSQEWTVFHTTQGGGGYVWENLAADSSLLCGSAWSSNGKGFLATLGCPFGAGGAYGFAQVWNGT